MAYEDPRKVERTTELDKRETQPRAETEREEEWDNQDNGAFRYTDWASI